MQEQLKYAHCLLLQMQPHPHRAAVRLGQLGGAAALRQPLGLGSPRWGPVGLFTS